MDEIYTGKLESEDEDQLPTAIRAAVLLLREKFADNDSRIRDQSDSHCSDKRSTKPKY